MHAIKIDLPDVDEIEIHIFSDLHIGEHECDLVNVQNRLEAVKQNPNAYIICNGDLCNNAIKSSVSDIYSETASPMAQLELLNKLFSPVKDRILCLTNGNHEARTYITDGIDMSAVLASQLDIHDRYSPNGIVLFVKVGSRQLRSNKIVPLVYSIYVTHGSAGGRKEGGKINRLADLANIVDTDIYIMGHTHMPAVLKESFYRADMSNCVVHKVDKLFVNSSASLDYGGYGERYNYKPNSKECPIIKMSGRTKAFYATL